MAGGATRPKKAKLSSQPLLKQWPIAQATAPTQTEPIQSAQIDASAKPKPSTTPRWRNETEESEAFFAAIAQAIAACMPTPG